MRCALHAISSFWSMITSTLACLPKLGEQNQPVGGAEESPMYFVRNLKAQDAKDGHDQQIEYEVSTDGETIGEIRFGPYFFTIWEFARKRDGQPRKLLLRVREVRLGERPQASKKGYYHGGDLADEVAALSSLFLRRRFQVSALVRRDEQPLLIARERDDDDLIDRALVSGTRNLEHLGPWFEHIARFEPKLHLALMLAVRMYHRGILQIEDAPDLAYLNFVSAIEVLCQRHPIPPVALEEVDAGLATAVAQIADDKVRAAVTKRLIDRERFIAKRFVQFILDHVDAGFWNDPNRISGSRRHCAGCSSWSTSIQPIV